jgi:hypothetical protein
MATTILIKRDTSTNWSNNNPILRSGEFGLETDTRKIKIGNGQRWNSINKFMQPSENNLEALLVNYILASEKGSINGVASLDSSGKILLSQLPDQLSLDTELSNALSALTTSSITEGTNKYFTNQRAIDAVATNYDPAGSAATAKTQAQAYADGLATNYDPAGSAATAKTQAQAYADGLATNYDPAGSAATAKTQAQAYADGLATNYDPAGSAATAKTEAQAYADTLASNYDPSGSADAAETAAKIYTDEIAIDLLNNIGDSLGDYIPLNQFGTPSGVATLDSNGVLNLAQVPSSIATKAYADTAESDAITTAGTAADSKISTAVAALTKSSVGLGNVDNTADASKPVSTAQAAAIATAKSEAIADATAQVNAVIASAPAALNTLDELSAALGDDASFAATITSSLTAKAPLTNPTFTGTVSGVTKSHVGLANVDNTSDANKPISTATQIALDEKINKIIETNPQPGSYSIIASDAFKLIEMSGGGTLTITDSVSFPTGTTIEVLQTTDSQVTIAGSGFTPNSTPGLKLRARWSSATLLKRGTNSWVVMGDLSA